MGLFANAAKQIQKETKGKFEPLELDEMNVQAIFNRCLATKDTPESDEQLSMLFKKVMGYDQDDTPIVFSKSKIGQNKGNILYLLGQLSSVHKGSRFITAKESIFRYDEKKWTTDTATIMKLYHLAEASNGMDPFVKKYNRATTTPSVKPTLSPKDLNFPAWWEQHKSEWETPKKEGKEPFED